MTTGSHLRFGLWTAAVLLIGGVPWLMWVSMGPIPYGGCGNPGAFVGAAVSGALFLPAIAAPICMLPAIIGYALAASRVTIGDPQGALPREALTGYVKLCGALIFVEASYSVLYLFHRSIDGISGLIYLVLGLVGWLALIGLLIASFVVAYRLARISKVIQHARAVCVHCGFAVVQDPRRGCPLCGGDVFTGGSGANATES